MEGISWYMIEIYFTTGRWSIPNLLFFLHYLRQKDQNTQIMVHSIHLHPLTLTYI